MRKLLLLSFITLQFQCLATTLSVCSQCPFQTITAALDSAADLDTILIQGGTHVVENIVIRKKVTFIGSQQATIVSKSGDEIFTVLAHHVTIKGLIFKNVSTSYIKERAAIRIKKKRHYTIANNTIIDCFFGIYLEHANKGLVVNNEIIGNATTEAASGNGIHAWYCEELNIKDNRIQKHRDGIYFEFVNNSNISGNKSFLNTRYGLHFMFSNDDSYLHNSFTNNGVGVAVMFSRRIKMAYNLFEFNWGRTSYGLLLKEIYDAEIEQNTFEQNTIAIFVEGCNRIIYQKNEFLQNGWAIKFSGGCEDNEITQNNFINNSMDLVVSSKLASNKFHHNFWSSYSGYDLDDNNIGDVPYYPVKLFSYILDQTPEAIVLMRSIFIELVNLSEQVNPVFTPKDVIDDFPLMEQITYD